MVVMLTVGVAENQEEEAAEAAEGLESDALDIQ